METSREITNYDLDILGEIGNIGSGKAATALSEMLNLPVILEVPFVKVCKLPEVASSLGDEEELRTAVFFEVHNCLNGFIVFILKDEFVDRICNIVAGEYTIDSDSVISEIGNILTGSYVGALSEMMDESIDITPPQVGHDMLGALMDAMVSCLYSVAEETVIITTSMTINNETIPGFYILLLEQESLNKLLNYFNGQFE